MNKQTSNFFDKKKTFSLLQNSIKIFIQLGKFSSLYSSRLPWNLNNTARLPVINYEKKKKKTNMNEAQDHVFHQISRPTKSKVQFPIKGFFFSKDLQLL